MRVETPGILHYPHQLKDQSRPLGERLNGGQPSSASRVKGLLPGVEAWSKAWFRQQDKGLIPGLRVDAWCDRAGLGKLGEITPGCLPPYPHVTHHCLDTQLKHLSH